MPCKFLCCVRKQVEDVRELDYSHCSLSDVPNEVFTYERTLERLHCQSNRIAELPRQLFICQELKVLSLSDNEIQEIPPAISSLTNLQLLDCSKNAISTLPDTIKCLKQLCVLDLSVNPIEKLPDIVTNLIFLQELYLNDVYLEYLPGNFGRLTTLKILELRDNYLMILPKSLARSSELMRLDIGENEFNEFPEVIGKFCKLQELWIDCNAINSIPTVIENLVNLIHLEAGNNHITEIAEEIACCKQLVDVSLSHNQLGEVPNSIGCLFNLVSLKLDHNNLFVLPEGIGDLVNLEELMLQTNMLREIPSTIGRLRKLQILNVDENMLTAVPAELGCCQSLSVLSLRANKLTSIPSELGHLSSLRVLNLVKNSLENLPHTLLNCDQLVALWLSENQSKPLVPMQSEIDPKTRKEVLTCFLFPQLIESPSETVKENDRKSNSSDAPVTPRHISFVDVKTVNKNIPDKPGQLRRAPTPYPKELRALAKHARNYQRDSADETILSLQNAVHIKAAKIAPTLQQKFASNHAVSPIAAPSNACYDNDHLEDPSKSAETPLLSPASVNSYDKPVGAEADQSYQNLDQTLYSGSNDSAYGGYVGGNLKVDDSQSDVLVPPLKNISVEERVDGIIKRSAHDLYPLTNRNSPSGGVPSIETMSSGTRSSLASTTGPNSYIYPRGKDLYECNSAEKIYGIVSPQQKLSNDVNGIGLPSMNNFYSHGNKDKSFLNHNESGSYTSYKLNLTADLNTTLSSQSSPSANVISDSASVYYHNRTMNNNSNQHEHAMESIYNSNQMSASYHNHLNRNNVELNYDTASVSSKQSGGYPPQNHHNYSLYNNYSSIYDSLPNGNMDQQRHPHPPRSHNVPPFPPVGDPPPYHIAATFSKQAHFFNPNC